MGRKSFTQNTFGGFEPQACKGKIKSHPSVAPCCFTEESCTRLAASRDCTLSLELFRYLSTMWIHFWQHNLISATSVISTSAQRPLCRRMSGTAERKGTKSQH